MDKKEEVKDNLKQGVDEVKPKPTTKSSTSIDTEKLISIVQSLQFAWFVGHLFTLFGTFYFILTYVGIFPSWYKFWYNVAVIGIIESFGILIYQHFRKSGTKDLIGDDNVHYFSLGVLLLVLRPYIIFPILPFQLYSLFHVLSYTKAYLLPILGQENSSIDKVITNFINLNNQKSIQLASLLELISLGLLAVRVLLFRKRSLSPFLVYLVFIKLRYEKSPIIRHYFKTIELKIDDVVNNLNNPNVKNIWIKVKLGFGKLDGVVLVNDYKKNKVN